MHCIAQIPFFKAIINQYYGINLQSGVMFMLIIGFPFIIVLMYKYKIQNQIKDKIAVLTQKGSEEKAKWKALVNYMEDYSLLDEKEISDLVVWEKYLVYATALGISEKVIKNMKNKLPKVLIEEKWDDEIIKEKYPVLYFVYNPIYTHGDLSININPINKITSNVSRAYSTSQTQIALHTSSSSGSGGGGGRRWPVAGMGADRKENENEKKSNSRKLENEYVTK